MRQRARASTRAEGVFRCRAPLRSPRSAPHPSLQRHCKPRGEAAAWCRRQGRVDYLPAPNAHARRAKVDSARAEAGAARAAARCGAPAAHPRVLDRRRAGRGDWRAAAACRRSPGSRRASATRACSSSSTPITVILILIFGFLVTRNFWKLVGERRRGILGSHLNLKFVAAFVLIALVTTTGLFAVSAFFITNSIDTWFSVQVDRALEESGEVAKSHYETVAKNALFYGGAHRGANPRGAADARRTTAPRSRRSSRRSSATTTSASSRSSARAARSWSPRSIPRSPRRTSRGPTARSCARRSSGREPGWHVDEVGSGDAIRGAVPIESASKPGEVVGAVVVNVLVPFSQARKVASIRSTLDEYRRLQPTAGHVRGAYLLELLLAFTMVLMLALWMGFRLARGVTGPLRALAQGTGRRRARQSRRAGGGRHRRRGRAAGRLVQPDDPRPARRAERQRAQGHRARAAAPLHGDRARQRRRRRGVRRAGPPHLRDQPVRAALPRHSGGHRPARPAPRGRRQPRRSCWR